MRISSLLKNLLKKNRKMVNDFYRRRMKGLAEINANDGKQTKVVKYIAESIRVSNDDELGSIMSVVKWTTLEDDEISSS